MEAKNNGNGLERLGLEAERPVPRPCISKKRTDEAQMM